ncbi:putative lipopolysaccharide heptosyltransferase III [Candidatus Pseudothioglobus singularis]|nr:putative lipopolysaccharide heptosyltransferase III [Candidatus Pseudothioglobus singularis]
MKILLLKFRNIGDVLLITPLISNLKSYYPESKIDIAVNVGTEAMLTFNPNINKVITYERDFVKGLSFFIRLYEEIKFTCQFRKENYDIVINLTEGDRGSQITWLSGALVRIGYKNNWFFKDIYTHLLLEQGFEHTVETNLNPLKKLDIPIKDKKVEIFWSKDDETHVQKELNNINDFIHIHPVSRWLFKCIADNTMAQIIDFCELKLGSKVILTASSEKFELDKVDKILNYCKSKPINLAGKFSLNQIAALNNKSKLFIGVDTSIMHISASNNIPVFAFFGPSGANHWGPWDNDLIESGYTKINGFQTMGRHRVFAESRRCQPCGQDGCDGTKISNCLMEMDIDVIKKNIMEMYSE